MSGLVSAGKGGPLEHFDKRQEASLDIATEENIPSESLDLRGRGTDTRRWEDAERRQALPYSVPGWGV